MKLTKKLIPAIGMLMLSTAMMVTSSFAWFSMNTNVTATDMSVTATADQVFLQIIDVTGSFDPNASQIEAEASNKSATLLPTAVVKSINQSDDKQVVSFVDGAGGYKWVKNTSSTAEDHEATGSYTEVGESEAGNYYLKNTFKIRLNPNAGKQVADGPLKVSGVALTDAYTSDFRNCVSVLVVCGSNAQLWRQTADGEDNMVFTATGDEDLAKEADGTNAGKFVSNDNGVDVSVYVFFDGENENCTIEKVNKTEAYSVEISFTCAAPQQA